MAKTCEKLNANLTFFTSSLADRPSTCIQWKRSPKTRLFKNTLLSGTCPAEWRFVKNTAGLSFTRGWTKHDVMHHLLPALRMPCEGCYRILIVFPSFSCGWVKAIRRRYLWTCIFSQTEGKISVSKLSVYVLTGT